MCLGLTYADLKTMSVYTRATQKLGVSRKDLGFLVDGKQNISQLCASAAKTTNWAALEEHC